ncbi:hypothetical protein CANARDRAFT_24827 [[Candida] arabinofermentans NRRL YB-2248]|uniref:Uncharacterized protein n=1 Tax=[Candida] arabinofermentans NRRL YB-2248 TaxID=983967 RepID=A0A1E4SVZ0_9ASCO|nr:hypothetical protein CANARDRAFT_24827 [[Candida] arabinofermentans NRRL YB-2248]
MTLVNTLDQLMTVSNRYTMTESDNCRLELMENTSNASIYIDSILNEAKRLNRKSTGAKSKSKFKSNQDFQISDSPTSIADVSLYSAEARIVQQSYHSTDSNDLPFSFCNEFLNTDSNSNSDSNRLTNEGGEFCSIVDEIEIYHGPQGPKTPEVQETNDQQQTILVNDEPLSEPHHDRKNFTDTSLSFLNLNLNLNGKHSTDVSSSSTNKDLFKVSFPTNHKESIAQFASDTIETAFNDKEADYIFVEPIISIDDNVDDDNQNEDDQDMKLNLVVPLTFISKSKINTDENSEFESQVDKSINSNSNSRQIKQNSKNTRSKSIKKREMMMSVFGLIKHHNDENEQAF